MEVEMKIRGLMMDPVTNMPIVMLKDVGRDTVLPIWVGVYEANAIALEIEKVSAPRPMTHDLIKNVLTGLDAQVHKVVVTELREDRQGCACRAPFARRTEGRHRVPGKRHRKALRQSPAAAVGIGPLGCCAIDAGHAGHRAQCRLHIALRAGPDPVDRPAAARLGLPAALLESYTETVLGLDPAPFAARLAELTASEDVLSDRELDSEALERLAADQQALIEDRDDGWLENAAAQLESAGGRSIDPGPASGRKPIAACRNSIISRAPRSRSRPWCSAMADFRLAPAWRFRGIRRRASPSR